jgi:hypothetical protein
MEGPKSLISLIYLSCEAVHFTEPDLQDLLGKARANNSNLGVTGMLLFKDGNFLQILEGETKTVLSLYEKIRQDRRHKNLTVLSQDAIKVRIFSDWSMGFHDLRSPEMTNRPDFGSFLDVSLAAADLSADPDRIKKLLLFFKGDKPFKGVGAL